MNVLAVDQGTSSTKALVIGAGGGILGEGTAEIHPQPGPGGAVTQDPQKLLDSVIAAGREALAAAGVPVGAVGIGNQGETVLLWDRDSGEPRGPAIGWQDRRATMITRELAAHAERLTEISGLPLDPYFAAPKMTWLRRQPGNERGVVTTIDSWVIQRLTGAYVTDVATASRTMLLDLDSGQWSAEACQLFGVEADEQPAIAGNVEPVGTTTEFGPELPVTALIVDQQAALLAQSCLAAGEAKCTYGTGAFRLANAGARSPRSGTKLAACVAWQLGSEPLTYCIDAQIYTAGAAIGWLQELGLIATAAELDVLAGEGRRPAEVPIFLPALAGLGAPEWAPEARGGWLGLSLASTRSELVDAVLWGIAAQVGHLAAAMAGDLGAGLSALRVDGGLTRSRRLMQAQADLLQAPVEVYPSPDATALGIGALARLGVGEAQTASEAIGEWRPVAEYEPRLGADEAAVFLERHAAATRAAVELSGVV